jgi:hypothetical protein
MNFRRVSVRPQHPESDEAETPVMADQIFGRFDFDARFMIDLRPACSLDLTIWHRLKVSMEGYILFNRQGRTCELRWDSCLGARA